MRCTPLQKKSALPIVLLDASRRRSSNQLQLAVYGKRGLPGHARRDRFGPVFGLF